jgi:ubiquinone/menaquinone biosynthesis C-methylase UbiE
MRAGRGSAVVKEAQTFAVKRAEVEFHNFASFGEPERAIAQYAEENRRRGELIRKHLGFIGELTPFLDLGANAGHTSYLLANDFGADGFALDLSADSLRHGIALKEAWGLSREPVRLAGDAANLPFADGSVRLVMAFQMLSQFQDMERVFVEAKRVLAPGGIFLFGEEAMKRVLSLRLYRCPYYQSMKPWERKLYDWGLLGYVARDVIGADQEESFGIRQNYSMGLKDWQRLIRSHFAEAEFEMFVPEQGWGERVLKRAATRLNRDRCEWDRGALAGAESWRQYVGKKAPATPIAYRPENFERCLRCPDCRGALHREAGILLSCSACGYQAPSARRRLQPAAIEGNAPNYTQATGRTPSIFRTPDMKSGSSAPGTSSRASTETSIVGSVRRPRFVWSRLASGRSACEFRGHAAEGTCHQN